MSIFKNFNTNDRIAIRSPLYQSNTIKRSEFSSSDNSNILTGTNNSYVMFYKSGSTNTQSSLVFDVSAGCSKTVPLALLNNSDESQMKNNYSEFSKVLFGLDPTGSIYNFDLDFADSESINYPLHFSYFLDISRFLMKDELRKGYLSLILGVGTGSSGQDTTITLSDVSGATNYKTDSPVGEYGALYVVTSSNASNIAGDAIPANTIAGLVFYQAGAVVLSPYVFAASSSSDAPSSTFTVDSFNKNNKGLLKFAASMSYDATGFVKSIGDTFISQSLPKAAVALQNSVLTMSYHSTTEVNSTVYFCRIFNNEFNYSSNPTYLSSSQIIVKSNDSTNQPVSYITTVGLYSDDNQLLAVAKLSEPIKKTPENELIIRTRLDF